MTQSQRTSTTPLEALLVTGMAFGLFIVSSVQAVSANFASAAFSDNSLLWIAGVELMLSAAAVTFLYLRGFAVATLMPAPTFKGTITGIGLFFAAWLIGQIVVAPFVGGQPQQPIEVMVNEARVSVPIVVTMAMVNGTFEEVFLLGFLLRGLRGYGLSVALGITLLVRVLCHLYQGPLGCLWVVGFGFTFAVCYMRSTQLWPPVFAHILWDIIPFLYV